MLNPSVSPLADRKGSDMNGSLLPKLHLPARANVSTYRGRHEIVMVEMVCSVVFVCKVRARICSVSNVENMLRVKCYVVSLADAFGILIRKIFSLH